MKNLNKLRLGLLLITITVWISLAFVPDLIADKKYNRESGVRTIVIDPGHGGHDSGCHGAGAYEKNVALAVSLKLGKLIEANFSDIKVIYTRKTDVFVELYRRAQIANENKADLFICIHCNQVHRLIKRTDNVKGSENTTPFAGQSLPTRLNLTA